MTGLACKNSVEYYIGNENKITANVRIKQCLRQHCKLQEVE